MQNYKDKVFSLKQCTVQSNKTRNMSEDSKLVEHISSHFNVKSSYFKCRNTGSFVTLNVYLRRERIKIMRRTLHKRQKTTNMQTVCY